MKKWIKTALMSCMNLLALMVNAQENFPAADIHVNENITTFIVSGETIKLMDISVMDTVVVGNQPGDNIVRLKASKPRKEGEKLGVVTIIGERSIAQYNIHYTSVKEKATTEYRIRNGEAKSYVNPAVEMDRGTMYEYCWRIWESNKRFYDVSNSSNKLKIRLNNLYSVGGYFFMDITIDNKSKIRFDIEEIRIKLCDKKQSKATSTQEIELRPELDMMPCSSFNRTYRSIFVIKKLTFPDEKILEITVSEKTISGRTITLRIDYADVLNADSFDKSLMR